jgi:tRNA nucleotidyltransferase/poly(A) polymerase
MLRHGFVSQHKFSIDDLRFTRLLICSFANYPFCMPDDSQSSVSPYAGRWVARVRGRIVAQAGTPEQALQTAQKSRHKEKPEIIYVPAPYSHPPLGDKVLDVLPNQEIYLVGGAVRDMMLNRLSRDLDFALPSNGISSARRVANALRSDFMVLDDERDTGRVIVTEPDGTRIFLDFATYRGGNLEGDLRARDFTINAIAYDLRANTILDPLNGAADVRGKTIRACSQMSITDDSVRVLRGVRLAAALGFKIELGTRKLMKQAANLLPNISPERKRDELFKILEGPKPDESMRALEMLDVFPHLLPELSAMKGVEQSPPHVYDVREHTLKVLKYLEKIITILSQSQPFQTSNDPFNDLLIQRLGKYKENFNEHFAESLNTNRSVRAALFFAALYHDVEKPATKSVDEAGRIRFFDHDVKGAEVAAGRGQSLNLSNDEIERIKVIVKNHMRFHFFTNQLEDKQQEPSRRAIYRFFRDSGEAGVDLILLGLADLRGTRGDTLSQETWQAALNIACILLENYWERPQETVAPQRLLNGHDLMNEFNLEAGPIIGELLEAIREGQATGKITTRADAISFGREWLTKTQKS